MASGGSNLQTVNDSYTDSGERAYLEGHKA